MTEVTRIFAEYCATIRWDGLPGTVQTRTRFLLLDLLGNILRGRHDAESSLPLMAAARAMGHGAGHHAVFGEQSRWSPSGAAQPTWKRLVHAPLCRKASEPAHWLSAMPSASAICAAFSPSTRPAAAAAPKAPQVAAGLKPRS